MQKTNITIRKTAKTYKVPLWKVAEKMNISEPTMTRLLRRELPEAETAHIIGIIKEIAEAR